MMGEVSTATTRGLICAIGTTALSLMLACVPAIRSTRKAPPSEAKLQELWEDPADLETRDLFWGPWGQAYAPAPDSTYSFVKEKTSGFSPGFTVTDPQGGEWSVKQGPESQVEVVVSRILSAVGFHQPPVYYLGTWKKQGGPGAAEQTAGRFRPKRDGLDDKGQWSWQQNPFVGTPQYGGLLSLMMLLNGSDLKNANNSLYEVDAASHSAGPRHWYVVRDLGAALGETGRIEPRRGDPLVFGRIGFIRAVTGDRVQFNYRGRHQELVRHISTRDVRWMTQLVSRLSDRQWRDAFRAGGYGPETSASFIATIKARLHDGLLASQLQSDSGF
jgi:hypothetical protein